jgi:spore germination protein YaaH
MQKLATLILLFTVGCGGTNGTPAQSSSTNNNPGASSPSGSASGSAPTPSNPAANDPTANNPTPGSPTPGSPTPAAAVDHTRCGWISGNDPVGEASFVAHAAEFQFVHPAWYDLGSDGVSATPIAHTDLPSIMQAAAANHVKVAPLIGTTDVNAIRTLINDPARRTQHAQTLAQLAQSHGYAGFDIDYEHLWSADDRAPFLAFMQELANDLHAVGAQLSMAIPAIDVDSGQSAYDYAALAGICDAIHVMGYDFHWSSGDHLGPLAPLGWIDAVFAHAQATGHPDRFILGVGNYAIGSGWFTTARDAATRCTSPLATSTDHMLTCPYGHQEAGRALSCNTASGWLWFEDVQSMEEKIAAAQAHGARGVTYWTIGDELDGYFDMVRRHYP